MLHEDGRAGGLELGAGAVAPQDADAVEAVVAGELAALRAEVAEVWADRTAGTAPR